MDIHQDLPPRLDTRTNRKLPFDADEVLERIDDLVETLPPTLHVALFDEGFRSVFQHVAIAVLSNRSPDEATHQAARNLFRWAGTPERVHRLQALQIESLIATVPYADVKAARLKEIAQISVERYSGDLPGRERILRALPGIGATCANLVLGLVCEQDKLCVGAHVQRVTTRWGLVTATSPGGIESQLSEKIPRDLWRFVGEWLTTFGTYVCTRDNPKCSTCPVLSYCHQVGVESPV